MTAGRHLHDIHNLLHLVGHWTSLDNSTRSYAVHRMRLLHIAINKGWQAALYFDQQGADTFLLLLLLISLILFFI
jgi:hypothetical protein